jgi:hypothetical protein
LPIRIACRATTARVARSYLCAHTVLPLFLHRYTPFSQYGLSQNFRLWQS